MKSDTITPHVFIVDDDRTMRESMVHLLHRTGCVVDAFRSGEEALVALDSQMPDVLVTDVRMPGMSGMELLETVKGRLPLLPVVMISAHGDVPMAVEAMQIGAYSFLEKPFDPQRLMRVVGHAAEANRLSQENKRLKERLGDLAGLNQVLLGDTMAMRTVREDVMDIADTEAAVLILGETGTGKEVVARAIHDLSTRMSGPFIAVNCSAIPENLFEASMFGHEAGAFTGANKASKGYFTSAHEGTLFLDELGTCPLDQQAKLLRAIETREVVPVGSTKPVSVNIRIVSATNEGLDKAVAEGRFREDLYYRLNTMEIKLPPLRDRKDDVPLLFTHFLTRHAQAYECEAPVLTPEDLSTLMAHDWPGNVRELRHVAERRILMARRGRGSVTEAMSRMGAGGSDADEFNGNLKEALAAYERQLIASALKVHKGKMDATAEALGIGRRTLNEKLVKLEINREEYV